jgi:iron complex outermembrane receptor protein
VCVFGAAIVAPPAPAAEPFFDDIPIVLTASRLAQSPLDAPAAVTIVDREMIEASGFTELHDLLRLVPGFLVADWPGGSPTVANHGLGDAYDRRIKVMIDGRTVNSPLWGNTNWQDLPVRVDDIERLEVVRGPNGAAYGVNAFQGVVNIITRVPATEDGATVISRLGEDGFADHGFRLNGRNEAAIDWRLSGSHRRARNFQSMRDDDGEPNAREEIARTVLNLSATAQLTTRDELGLQLGLADGVTERGTPGDLIDPVRDEDMRARYLNLAWRRSFSADTELALHYYHQDERVDADWVARLPLPGGMVLRIPVDTDSEVRRDELELQYVTRLAPAWRVMVGAGLRREAVRSARFFNTKGTLSGTSSQLFGDLGWAPLERLKIDAGGTFEHHHYSGGLFSPRLAANFALTPESALRLSAGIAYRAPAFAEAAAEEVIRLGREIKQIGLWATQRIEPERVRYAEFGYVAQFRAIGLGLDMRAFRERYDRYIDDRRCWNPVVTPRGETIATRSPACLLPPPPRYVPFDQQRPQRAFEAVNSGAFTMDGAEFSVDWRRPGWGRLVLSQAFIDIDEEGGVSDPDIVRSAPSSLSSLLLVKALPGRWRASLGYYRNSLMYWLNDGDRVPERNRIDLRLARGFGPPADGNEIALTAQSVEGSYPEFHEGRYRHEPRLFASLRVTW